MTTTPSDSPARDDDDARAGQRAKDGGSGDAGTTGDAQRDALLRSEREAHEQQPRNFKEDALSDKQVHVEPDGTGPSPMDTLDPPGR